MTFWGTDEIIALVDHVREIRPELAAMFAVNRKIVKTALGRAIGSALVEYPLPVLPTEIVQRVAFADTATRGDRL